MKKNTNNNLNEKISKDSREIASLLVYFVVYSCYCEFIAQLIQMPGANGQNAIKLPNITNVTITSTSTPPTSIPPPSSPDYEPGILLYIIFGLIPLIIVAACCTTKYLEKSLKKEKFVADTRRGNIHESQWRYETEIVYESYDDEQGLVINSNNTNTNININEEDDINKSGLEYDTGYLFNGDSDEY